MALWFTDVYCQEMHHYHDRDKCGEDRQRLQGWKRQMHRMAVAPEQSFHCSNKRFRAPSEEVCNIVTHKISRASLFSWLSSSSLFSAYPHLLVCGHTHTSFTNHSTIYSPSCFDRFVRYSYVISFPPTFWDIRWKSGIKDKLILVQKNWKCINSWTAFSISIFRKHSEDLTTWAALLY